ncbi:unnamed protein product [Lathyrus sativus]|nr:unnamed protein product [Lathyrus sativus]
MTNILKPKPISYSFPETCSSPSQTEPPNIPNNPSNSDDACSSFDILNYESWVCPQVLKRHSIFISNESILPLLQKIQLTHHSSHANELACLPCSEEERVCWQHTDENEPHFIYMYVFLFEKLLISLPFSKFQCDVLAALNVAPSQLHPNTWGFIRAFEILCSCVGVEPSADKFLYFFQVKVSGKVGWISASGRSGRRLLNAFCSSYKNWKNMFFKVRSGLLLDEGGNSQFPLRWTTDPVPFNTFEIDRLDEVEREEIQLLIGLPVFHCAKLIALNENRDALMAHFSEMTRFKFKKKDLEKFINVKPSTDPITRNSPPNRTMASPSGSQLKEKKRKRTSEVPAEPVPHKQTRVNKSPVLLASAGNVPSVVPAPTIPVQNLEAMWDDAHGSSSEIDRPCFSKLRKEDMVEAAKVYQLRALTLIKEMEQVMISEGLEKLTNENEEDKRIKEIGDLKRKLEVAHKAQDKLKKELVDLNTKQEKWQKEKIDLESALKEERDLLKSTQVNLRDEKNKVQQAMSQAAHQYLEGFNCAKSQAAFLCSVDEGKLDGMRLWGQVRDGEIVVDDEGDESEDSDGQGDGLA